MRRLPIGLIHGLALHGFSVAEAGTTAGAFLVTVQPAQPSAPSQQGEICISSTLSAQTKAQVQVTCRGNQFVGIETLGTSTFVGVHGGAFRFVLGTRGFAPLSAPGSTAVFSGQGTVTAQRVLSLAESDERVDLLISF